MSEKQNVETALRVRRALESSEEGALQGFFTKDAEQVEWSNRLKPEGDRRGVAAMVMDLQKVKAILSSQGHDATRMAAERRAVAAEFRWAGVLEIAVGSLKPGVEMRVWSDLAMEFRDGKIHRQRNCDSFQAF